MRRFSIRPLSAATAAIAFGVIVAGAGGDELKVVSTSPAAQAVDVPARSPVRVRFDRAVDRTTVTDASFSAFGRWSGPVTGTFEFSEGDAEVALVPDRRLSSGEQVMVVLSSALRAADGSPMRSAGYSFQFWVKARAATRVFQEVQRLSTRSDPNQGTRAYGGIGSDLNHDGYLDLSIINEDSADLRVFLNRADGSGRFEHFLPPFPLNRRASPSEPADFNRDGHVDICVANINTRTVSVLLGKGDGTFGPQTEITVGTSPRGIVVLDVDGDGDIDIVNTNAGSSNLSLLINDGAGQFAAPVFFEGGGSGEWALGAADMDGDGILDLVVGAQQSQELIVQRCRGDATFALAGRGSAGGRVWMVTCGDLNRDGHADVAGVNGESNNAAIVFGDGAGGLSAPQIYTPDRFPLASDVGDIDGDGDLDWMTASYSGDFLLFANDGSGSFTLDQRFDAPLAASCCLLLDIDNDADLDLALIDELADVVIVLKQGGTSPHGDLNGDCAVDQRDLATLLAAYGADDGGDLDGDGDTDQADLAGLLAHYGERCP